MNFKYRALFLAWAFMFSSCSDFLKGKKESEETITVESNEACLKNFPLVFDKFVESKINDQEIDDALVCLNSTLTRFQNKFRGKEDKDVFSVDDITTIFNFFFKDLKISQVTSEKLIRFKYALIGGEEKTLSKVDVENLKAFLKDASVELKNISPWIAVYRSEKSDFSEANIRSAFGQLKISLINLLNSGYISKTHYSIEDFILLLKHFNFNLQPYSDQIQQLLIVKKLFIGDDYVKSKEKYMAAIELILDIMQINSMHENQHFKFDLKRPETKKNLMSLVKTLLDVVKTSAKMQTDQFLRLEPVQELLKLESNKIISFDDFQMLKVILFGGKAEVLTIQELKEFETKADLIIASGFKIYSLMNVNDPSQLIKASEEIQKEIKLISENTLIEPFLTSKNYSAKIFQFIYNALEERSDMQFLFTQVADQQTFTTKENILKFIRNVSLIHEQVDRLSSTQLNWQDETKIGINLMDRLNDLIQMKESQTLNLLESLPRMGPKVIPMESLTTGVRLLFPKMDLKAVTMADFSQGSLFLQSFVNEADQLMQFPEQRDNFDEYKKSLKKVLERTDFFITRSKSHYLIDTTLQALPANQVGFLKTVNENKQLIGAFLKLLIADREISRFEDLSLMLNTVFSAFQVYKKISVAADGKFSFDFLQEILGMLLVSDTMRVNKFVNIGELLKLVELFPQSKNSHENLKRNMNYLALIYPQTTSGHINQNLLEKMLLFILVLSQEKEVISKWPVNVAEFEIFKNSLEKVLAVTDFYTGREKVHKTLHSVIASALESDSEFFGKGQNLSTIQIFLQLLIADREIISFNDIESVLNTIFDGLEIYNKFYKSTTEIDLHVVIEALRFLKKSDFVKVNGYVRFDLLIQNLTPLLGRALNEIGADFKLSIEEIYSLKINFFGGDKSQLTRADIESVEQLIKLLESKNHSNLPTGSLTKIIKFFIKPESVQSVLKIFSPHNTAEAGQLAKISGEIVRMSVNLIKIKGELEAASSSKNLNFNMQILNKFLTELGALPVFQHNGNLDLRELKKALNESLGIELKYTEPMMKLKVYLLGGSPHLISKVDLQRLTQMVQFMGDRQARLMKDLDVLYLQKEARYEREEISKAAERIKNFAKGFLSFTNIADAGLTFKSFFELQNTLFGYHDLAKYQPLMQIAHNLLIGPYFNYSKEHFERLIDSYVDALKIFRFAQLNFIKFEINSRAQLLLTLDSLEDIYRVFDQSIAYATTKQIDTVYFDQLMTLLIQKGYIPYKVEPAILISFYKKMFNVVFSKQKKDTSQLPAITFEHMTNIKNEMILFRFYTNILDSAFEKVTTAASREQFNQKLRNTIIGSFESFAAEYQPLFAHDKTFFMKALGNYISELRHPRSIVFSNGLVISHYPLLYPSNWIDHARAHYIRTIARLLIQGWGENGSIQSKGLAKWNNDFRDFNLAIKNLDPRSGNSGAQSMTEANLFTFSGNGDDRLSFIESTQYIALLMTGGGSQYHFVYKLAEEHRCLSSERDPMGNNYVDTSCILSVYTRYYKKIFSNLNYFWDYIDRLPSERERTEFFRNVLEAARNTKNSKKDQLESFDLRTLNMILMYMESVYSVLDLDRNDRLSPKEIREGYERFDNLIFSVAQAKSANDLKDFAEDLSKAICRKENSVEKNMRYLAREAFIYLLYNGKMPGSEVVEEIQDVYAHGVDDAFYKKMYKSTINGIYYAYKVTEKAAKSVANGAATGWNCAYHDQLFSFEGEVDRKNMINTFKLLKTVLASE